MVDFKIDSGAEVNILLKIMYNNFHQCPQVKSTLIILAVGNNVNISVRYKSIDSVTHKNTVSPVIFVIADRNSKAVRGTDISEKLQSIKQGDFLTILQIRKY